MVAKVGETPSLTREFIGKWARDKQVGCVIPSLAPPPQAALKGSKEGCPALVYTEGPTPLQLNRCAETKKYGPNERTEHNFRKRAK